MKCHCGLELIAIEPCTGSTVRMESDSGEGGTGTVLWRNTIPTITDCVCDSCSRRADEALAEAVRGHFHLTREQWDALTHDKAMELTCQYQDWQELQYDLASCDDQKT